MPWAEEEDKISCDRGSDRLGGVGFVVGGAVPVLFVIPKEESSQTGDTGGWVGGVVPLQIRGSIVHLSGWPRSVVFVCSFVCVCMCMF